MDGQRDNHEQEADDGPHQAHSIERSNSSSTSSTDHHDDQHTELHAPIPVRPILPSRKSSGTIIVSRDDASARGSAKPRVEPGDVRAMSPRRTSEDLENLGKEARTELRRHAKALQDSLMTILSRIEAVKEEHDKLDNNNKFLQKYIGDLMTTTKITATTGRSKK